MPRKSKNTANAKSKPTASEKDPQPTLTEEQASTNPKSPKDRDDGGKFAKGNAGGPGNPHARACAKMLEVFRNAISEDEMLEICRMLFLKAVGGDISAAKVILSYKIGKPLPAPNPDSIDRDEWDHYQDDAIRNDEMKLVLSSLPTQAGNDIARVSLPIMTASRMNDFAAQLMDGLPPREHAEKGEGREERGERRKDKYQGFAVTKRENGPRVRGERRRKKGERRKDNAVTKREIRKGVGRQKRTQDG